MFQRLREFVYGSPVQNTNEARPKFEYALNKDEKEQLKQSEEKPKIVALYDKEGGTAYCDLTMNYLQAKGFDVIPVTPQEGLTHPAFTGKVNGIYLPGGPNVPVHDNSDPRKKLEGDLTELAQSKDIPLLGICRGQQTVAHFHRYEVTDIPEDSNQHELHYEHFDAVYKETQDPTYNSKVVVHEGSQLYNALRYKLNQKEGDIEYNVTCLHHQHVQEDPQNTSLQVTGRGKFDRMVESVEKRTGRFYTIGFQHHPEAVLSSCAEAREQKISELNTKYYDEQIGVNHFSDPEVGYHVLRQHEKRLREVTRAKPRDLQAAKGELGFFSSQVKKHYLTDAPKVDTKAKDDDYYAYFCS
ncbi:gamma-glutamyl-gamma-aminobutyrate hydrolase family protein [Legionella sp. PC997]|uniref:gamma-glutamyl-gamma-aminobutyrate hydrolase family protein n=1 Tax=Legionella sp. PC997 TaxID=2755562 RepID=UPI0015F79846|nr:gamma-glutamyl-gamma-aminobutyrate hydrolase family protein [Legionella sp. PC997]QMT61634.1 hypothetical protein HBNCFIEN_03038 [Legionella sp. PC997]